MTHSHLDQRILPETGRLPYALYRAEQVQRFDHLASGYFGIPERELMERAGASAYRFLRQRWPDARHLCVLTGIGNNGGDGYVLARLARGEGCTVDLIQVGDPQRLQGPAAESRDAYCAAGGKVDIWSGSLPRGLDLCVDALFGTGLTRPVGDPFAAAIAALNEQQAPILALDLPSGLHADTGEVMGIAARVTATISFIALKLGLFVGSGPEYRGEVQFSGLGVPARLYASEIAAAVRSDWARASTLLPHRSPLMHKGDCGHVLIIGGAPGMAGAVRLAGEAALRAGAGLVTIATHPRHADWLNLARPELMVQGVMDARDLEPLSARADVIAIGPGLGQDAWGRGLWEKVCTLAHPLVVDADALNLLAASPMNGPDWLLTPHPGEAARLLGVSTAEVQRDRVVAAQTLQAHFGGVIVLKGAGSIVQANPPRRPVVCSQGNPGMATAGMGDVLTGIIAALRAQGLAAEDAACAGVCLHAAAGDRAAASGERGLIASDLIAELRTLADGQDAVL
ncbi:NAD(P)H-hydrate dehydratase [Caldichromatium japonicum]|uniref:Bifunctional NAD(P)H-hydrate repair enzyme n=1 Tax=Caldichromatium japonicum TaxID=2699430 RepID=A0A6G7VEC8_9GAMM|nr:NAD(P)H-hydrate dehydratase [Caldichromatium japonicum]QIK38208.1 NAD(P)H-hydrate dehydratase [Caldichromatium japonicum]